MFGRRVVAAQPGQAGLISPDEVAVQGGGAPRSGVLPSARFLTPRLPRQAFQDAQGAGLFLTGTGGTTLVPNAPGQGMGIAVLDLPVPPTKMPRHAKHSTDTGSPLDSGSGLSGPLPYAAQPWDSRSTGWVGPVASISYANWHPQGGMVSDYGALAEWERGGAT